jgi:hypothetical protein
MITKIKKLVKLPLIEIHFLIIAFILLAVFKLLIKILPFNILQKKYQSWVTSKTTLANNQPKIAQKALAINRISYAFPFLGFSCLPKAMAMKYWLKAYQNIALHFGVQKDTSNNLIAHAWITQADKTILGDDPTTNYKSIWVWE